MTALDKLRKVAESVGIAQDNPAELIYELMDPKLIAELAKAFERDQVTVTRLFRQAGSVRGCRRAADEVFAMVKAVDVKPGPRERARYRGLDVPYGFTVSDSGVHIETEKGPAVVCRAPLVITGRSEDIDTGDKLLRVEWADGGAWFSETISRDEAMDSRKLVRLAKLGAPVSSVRASAAVQWLEALEAENRDSLPYEASCAHLGWAGKDSSRFVLPSSGILRTDPGTAQLAAAVRTQGEYSDWCAAIGRHATSRPLLMLAIYAAACTPLLRIIDAPGFVVDWSGETSRGKTTAMRVAASVWGVPSDESGFILKWSSASDVGPTTSAWFLQSLPLLLDDTKQGRRDVIGAMLYAIPGGQSRLKGTRDGGLQRTQTWRTCLLSTGEAPITSFNDHGGAVARTLCLTGGPMGEESPENEAEARALESSLRASFGHLGPRIAAFLADVGIHGKIRKRYHDLVELMAGEAESGVEARMCRYVATLAVAQQMVHHLGVPQWTGVDPIDVALEATRNGSMESDRPREALAAVVRWAAANQGKFWGRHGVSRDGDPIEPHGGFVGRWDKGGDRENWICIRPEVLHGLLSEWGYDVQSVLSSWDKRDWTADSSGSGGKRRRQVQVRVGGVKSRLVAIRQSAVNLVTD